MMTDEGKVESGICSVNCSSSLFFLCAQIVKKQ